MSVSSSHHPDKGRDGQSQPQSVIPAMDASLLPMDDSLGLPDELNMDFSPLGRVAALDTGSPKFDTTSGGDGVDRAKPMSVYDIQDIAITALGGKKRRRNEGSSEGGNGGSPSAESDGGGGNANGNVNDTTFNNSNQESEGGGNLSGNLNGDEVGGGGVKSSSNADTDGDKQHDSIPRRASGEILTEGVHVHEEKRLRLDHGESKQTSNMTPRSYHDESKQTSDLTPRSYPGPPTNCNAGPCDDYQFLPHFDTTGLVPIVYEGDQDASDMIAPAKPIINDPFYGSGEFARVLNFSGEQICGLIECKFSLEEVKEKMERARDEGKVDESDAGKDKSSGSSSKDNNTAGITSTNTGNTNGNALTKTSGSPDTTKTGSTIRIPPLLPTKAATKTPTKVKSHPKFSSLTRRDWLDQVYLPSLSTPSDGNPMIHMPHSFLRFVQDMDFSEDGAEYSGCNVNSEGDGNGNGEAKEALFHDDDLFEAGKTYYLIREDPRPQLRKLACSDNIEDLLAFIRGGIESISGRFTRSEFGDSGKSDGQLKPKEEANGNGNASSGGGGTSSGDSVTAGNHNAAKNENAADSDLANPGKQSPGKQNSAEKAEDRGMPDKQSIREFIWQELTKEADASAWLDKIYRAYSWIVYNGGRGNGNANANNPGSNNADNSANNSSGSSDQQSQSQSPTSNSSSSNFPYSNVDDQPFSYTPESPDVTTTKLTKRVEALFTLLLDSNCFEDVRMPDGSSLVYSGEPNQINNNFDPSLIGKSSKTMIRDGYLSVFDTVWPLRHTVLVYPALARNRTCSRPNVMFSLHDLLSCMHEGLGREGTYSKTI
jgi:hypothetical protein